MCVSLVGVSLVDLSVWEPNSAVLSSLLLSCWLSPHVCGTPSQVCWEPLSETTPTEAVWGWHGSALRTGIAIPPHHTYTHNTYTYTLHIHTMHTYTECACLQSTVDRRFFATHNTLLPFYEVSRFAIIGLCKCVVVMPYAFFFSLHL